MSVSTAEEILSTCAKHGHTMVDDPPIMGGTTRFTCSTCGRAVLHAAGGSHWYGRALTTTCGDPEWLRILDDAMTAELRAGHAMRLYVWEKNYDKKHGAEA